MNKKNGNDGKKSGRSKAWEDVKDAKKKVVGILSQALSQAGDNDERKHRALREELEARINVLEEQKLPLPEETPFMSDREFEQIIEKEKKQKEDQAVWKAYSKRGGISDILTDIRKAVEHPSANAFEFDEEEGMYIIFITLNNTYISRLTTLCNGVCSECEQIRNMEDSELKEERDGFQEIYKNLISEKGNLDKKLPDFQKQLKSVLHTQKEEREKALKRLEENLNSYEKKRECCAGGIKTYQERLRFFNEKCGQQKSYIPQYGALLGELVELGKISSKEHPFHVLTISPERKEELEQYMETAYAFSKWALQLIQEYPL